MYGSLGDHLGSILFLFGGYVSIMLWMWWTARRPRVEEEIPPVSLLPRGRRAGRSVHALDAARFRGPTTEAERPAPFDWNA